MGRLQAIRGTPNGNLVLSEVWYGFNLHKLLHRRKFREIFGFIPKYELAVMRGLNVRRCTICTLTRGRLI